MGQIFNRRCCSGVHLAPRTSTPVLVDLLQLISTALWQETLPLFAMSQAGSQALLGCLSWKKGIVKTGKWGSIEMMVHLKMWLRVLTRGSLLGNVTASLKTPLSSDVILLFDYAHYCRFLTVRAGKFYNAISSLGPSLSPLPIHWLK